MTHEPDSGCLLKFHWNTPTRVYVLSVLLLCCSSRGKQLRQRLDGLRSLRYLPSAFHSTRLLTPGVNDSRTNEYPCEHCTVKTQNIISSCEALPGYLLSIVSLSSPIGDASLDFFPFKFRSQTTQKYIEKKPAIFLPNFTFQGNQCF